jgi:hypothetical protein
VAVDDGSRFVVGDSVLSASITEVLDETDWLRAIGGHLHAEDVRAEGFGSAEVDCGTATRGRSFAH